MNIAHRELTEWPDSWRVEPHSIRTGRYIDPEFLRLEFERLWSKTWQIAARLDEIPEPGDFTTYDIGDQSVIVVRVDDDNIKAYYNACTHRGTALSAGGCGHFRNGRIICPFHGWRWDLEGNNQFVLQSEEFCGGELRDSDVALNEVHHEVYAGFVFINFDPDPMSFEEYIAPVRRYLDDLAIADMHHYWWKSIPVPANWKVAQEAFFEGYHVPATHPQLETDAAKIVFGDNPTNDADFTHHNILLDAFPHGHGRFYAGEKTPMRGQVRQKAEVDPAEVMADRLNLLVEGMDAQVLKEDIEIARSLIGKPIPEDSSLGAEFTKALYADAAAKQRPMPKPEPEVLGMWGGMLFIFPNFLILPFAGNAMMYRARPDARDPDRCTFEIFSTKSYPAAEKPPRAKVQQVTDFHDPEQVLRIPRQDLGNIPRMQIGLHAKGLERILLASHHEKVIMNMHRELDKYLGAPDAQD